MVQVTNPALGSPQTSYMCPLTDLLPSARRGFSKTSHQHYGVISNALTQIQSPFEAWLAVPVTAMVKVCVPETKPLAL